MINNNIKNLLKKEPKFDMAALELIKEVLDNDGENIKIANDWPISRIEQALAEMFIVDFEEGDWVPPFLYAIDAALDLATCYLQPHEVGIIFNEAAKESQFNPDGDTSNYDDTLLDIDRGILSYNIVQKSVTKIIEKEEKRLYE